MKSLFRVLIMFIVGFCAYISIEVLYRGYSYPLMGTMGGLVFILIDRINEKYSWDMELPYQAFIGGIYATITELIYGLITRFGMDIQMWDYSERAFNFMGIICPLYAFYWMLLSLVAILVADFINYCLDRNAEPPYYIILGKKYIPGIYKVFK